MKKLSELVEKLTAARAAMRAEGEAALKEAFSEFFEMHPGVRAIVWTQYTPHFNDGDACTFSVNEFELHADLTKVAADVKKYVKKEARSAYDSDDDDSDPFDVPYGHGSACVAAVLTNLEDNENNRQYNQYRKYKLRALTPEEKKLITDFEELESAYGELGDMAQEVIGDHVKVVVNRDGIRTTEYDHD